MWSQNSTSKNLPKSKLAEVEIGRSRKKKKLAKVEIGRSRSHSKSALPDRNRVGHQKSARIWPESGKATRVAKVGPNRFAKFGHTAFGQFFFLVGWWAGRVLGARRGDGPKGWGPEPRKGGARRVGGPKFRAFFFSLLPEISFFLLSLGGLLVEFWWCLKRRGAQMCALVVLWILCEAPAAPNVHVSGPRRFKHHQNSTRRHPRETQQERKWGREREKKSEILGGPVEGPSSGGGGVQRRGPENLEDTHQKS